MITQLMPGLFHVENPDEVNAVVNITDDSSYASFFVDNTPFYPAVVNIQQSVGEFDAVGQINVTYMTTSEAAAYLEQQRVLTTNASASLQDLMYWEKYGPNLIKAHQELVIRPLMALEITAADKNACNLVFKELIDDIDQKIAKAKADGQEITAINLKFSKTALEKLIGELSKAEAPPKGPEYAFLEDGIYFVTGYESLGLAIYDHWTKRFGKDSDIDKRLIRYPKNSFFPAIVKINADMGGSHRVRDIFVTYMNLSEYNDSLKKQLETITNMSTK